MSSSGWSWFRNTKSSRSSLHQRTNGGMPWVYGGKHDLSMSLLLLQSLERKLSCAFGLWKPLYLHVNRYKKKVFSWQRAACGVWARKAVLHSQKIAGFWQSTTYTKQMSAFNLCDGAPASPASLLLKTILHTKPCTVGVHPHPWPWLPPESPCVSYKSSQHSQVRGV